MRLIDADEAIEYCNQLIKVHRYYHPRSTTVNFPIDEIIDRINQVPTVDAVPVAHGHWIVVENDQNTDDRYKMKCSVCGGTLWSIEPEEWYCCKCGSKMDEVTE